VDMHYRGAPSELAAELRASGLAAATLSLERISQFAPDDRISIDLLRWAKDQLLAFDKGLEDVRRRGFHSSSQSPHMPWYWEE